MEQGKAMSVHRFNRRREGRERERERGREKERKSECMAKEETERQRRKEDGRILCQSLIKKRRAWHGQRGVARRSAVLGTGQMPVASPSCTVPLASVYGVTEYCYRGPRTEDRVQPRERLLCGFLYKLYLLCSVLFSPSPSSLFFDTFLSRFLFLIPSFFSFLLLSLLRSSALFDHICRFLSSLLFHRFNNTILLWFLDIVHVLLLFSSLIFEFQKDDTYIGMFHVVVPCDLLM